MGVPESSQQKEKVKCFQLCPACFSDLLDGYGILDGVLNLSDNWPVCITLDETPYTCGYSRLHGAVIVQSIEEHFLPV